MKIIYLPSLRPPSVLSTAVATIISRICAASIVPAAPASTPTSAPAVVPVLLPSAVGLLPPEMRRNVPNPPQTLRPEYSDLGPKCNLSS